MKGPLSAPATAVTARNLEELLTIPHVRTLRAWLNLVLGAASAACLLLLLAVYPILEGVHAVLRQVTRRELPPEALAAFDLASGLRAWPAALVCAAALLALAAAANAPPVLRWAEGRRRGVMVVVASAAACAVLAVVCGGLYPFLYFFPTRPWASAAFLLAFAGAAYLLRERGKRRRHRRERARRMRRRIVALLLRRLKARGQ